MPFDVIAFGEAAPGTGTPNVAAASGDNLYEVSGDDIIVRKEAAWLLGVFASVEDTGGYILLRQPSLDLDYCFNKVHIMTDPISVKGVTHLFGRPLPLVADEKLNCLVNNATDEDVLVALLVGSGKIPQSQLDAVNPTHHIRGYADQALTAFTWTTCSPTWNQDLPKGNYVPVGFRYLYWKTSGAMPAVARMVIPGKTSWRPGVVGMEMQADKLEVQECVPMRHCDWPFMPYLEFAHNRPPTFEVCGAEASSDHVFELALQKVS